MKELQAISEETQALDARVEPAGSPSCQRLFLVFLRLGLTAFGGPTMVAYIRDLAVKKKHWLSQESFEDGTALCQSIPGATAMQTVAYVGLRAGGPLGALAAFVGFGLPAFVLMVGLSAAYQAGRDLGPALTLNRPSLHLHSLRQLVFARAQRPIAQGLVMPSSSTHMLTFRACCRIPKEKIRVAVLAAAGESFLHAYRSP